MKTKTIFFFFIFGCCGANVFSQTSNWLWARSAVGWGGDYCIRSCTDPLGDVYVSGYFSSDTLCFGNDTLFHTNNYGSDVFLVKYDGMGNVLWAKNFASGRSYDNWDDNHDIAADDNGNVYFTAALFVDSAIYGNFTLVNDSTDYQSWGFSDVVVVKCNAGGNVLWANRMGGKKCDLPEGLCVDKNKNVYVSGSFNSYSIFFGNDTLLRTYVYNDIFILKYDSLGNEMWAREGTGYGFDQGRGIATDTLCNIYITGYFDSDILRFDNLLLLNSSPGKFDFFILKYDTNGNAIWAKKAAGGDDDWGQDVTVDHAGNILVTGYFRSSILLFDTITISNYTIGQLDIFVAKYDPFGNSIWAKHGGSPFSDLGSGICADANNAVYVTGRFDLPFAVFGNDTCMNTGTSGTGDVFITKYDSGGNEMWTRTAAGNGDDCGNSVCTDSNGDIYVSGWYWINISFGNILLQNAGSGGSEVFLAKLDGLTGMQELFYDNNISISPNPFTTTTTIQFTTTPQNAELNIYNLYGQEIKTIKNISTDKIIIERENLSSGIYFVRLMEVNKVIGNGKIIIE